MSPFHMSMVRGFCLTRVFPTFPFGRKHWYCTRRNVLATIICLSTPAGGQALGDGHVRPIMQCQWRGDINEHLPTNHIFFHCFFFYIFSCCYWGVHCPRSLVGRVWNFTMQTFLQCTLNAVRRLGGGAWRSPAQPAAPHGTSAAHGTLCAPRISSLASFHKVTNFYIFSLHI